MGGVGIFSLADWRDWDFSLEDAWLKVHTSIFIHNIIKLKSVHRDFRISNFRRMRKIYFLSEDCV